MKHSPDLARIERLLIEVKRLPWAKDLSAEAIQDFAEAGEFVQYQTGEVVQRAEEAMAWVYFIVSGRLQATVTDLLGNELLQRPLDRGAVFGFFTVASPEQSHTRVVASERSSMGVWSITFPPNCSSIRVATSSLPRA